MSETSDKAKAKLEAARQKAEKLRLMQEEVTRELAEAEALEVAESRDREREEAKRATAALHRSTEKEQRRRAALKRQAAASQDPDAATPTASNASGPASTVIAQPLDDGDLDEADFEDPDDDASVDERSSSSKSARKRLGLHCFNCNRYEGHYLSYYRRLWFSYLIGLTFGLAIIVGPYRCQCCGSTRFMMADLLNPRYYLAISKTRSKKRSRSSRSDSSRR